MITDKADLEAFITGPIRPYVEQRLTPEEAHLAMDLAIRYRGAAPYIASDLGFQSYEAGRLQDEKTWRRIAVCLFHFEMMELPDQEVAN